MKYEDKLDQKLICGIDEVGRGPLAGPVVAAAIVMPKEKIEGVKDSKKLTKKRRETLDQEIRSQVLALGFGISSPQEIDEINIKEATIKAMEEALDILRQTLEPDLVLVDAEKIHTDLETEALIKGDDISYNIACASIVAKVFRDRIMEDYAKIYPGYSLETNMGYGTKAHREALVERGYTPIHRLSFLTKMEGLVKSEDW